MSFHWHFGPGVLAKIVAEFKLSLLFSYLCKPGFLKLCFSLPVRCLVSKLHIRRRFARMLWTRNYLTTKKLGSVSATEKCIPFKVGSQMLEYCPIRTLDNLTCAKTKPVMNLSLQYLSIETWGHLAWELKKKALQQPYLKCKNSVQQLKISVTVFLICSWHKNLSASCHI